MRSAGHPDRRATRLRVADFPRKEDFPRFLALGEGGRYRDMHPARARPGFRALAGVICVMTLVGLGVGLWASFQGMWPILVVAGIVSPLFLWAFGGVAVSGQAFRFKSHESQRHSDA